MNLTQRLFQDRRFAAVYERVRESPLAWPLVGRTIDEEARDALAAVDRGVARGETPRVLDVACGQGTFTVAVARARPLLRVVGLDLSSAQVERARLRARRRGLTNAEFVVGDVTVTTFESATFSAAIFMGGLHQIPDHRGVAREVARLLRPGGTFHGAFFSRDGEPGAVRAALETFSGMTLVDGRAWGRVLAEAGFDDYRFERRTPVWGVFEATRSG